MSDTAHDPWGFDEAPETRTPRKLETRASMDRGLEYQPSSILPDPEPSDGWVFRWCVVSIHDKSEHGLFQKRLREGWETVRVEDHPEIAAGVGFGDQKYKGLIEIGGLVLCKQPAELSEKRRAYYANFTRQKTEDADNAFLRDNSEKAMLKVAEKRRQTFTYTR